MAVSCASQIEADFIDILLKAANADMSPRDLPALASLMRVCLEGDEARLSEMAQHPNPRIRGEARFILKKHTFNKARRLVMSPGSLS